jgi:hypothetical protein
MLDNVVARDVKSASGRASFAWLAVLTRRVCRLESQAYRDQVQVRLDQVVERRLNP